MATTKYDAIILRAANDNGIPPAVLWGLLSQESGFNPTARGYNKNALGVVVSTDRGIAQINDKAHPDVSDSMADDPNQAIPWAGKYLGRLSKQYGGNVTKFLTGYNSGHWEKVLEDKYGYAKKVLAKAAQSPFSSVGYAPTEDTTGSARATDYTAYQGKYSTQKPVTDKLMDYWEDEFPSNRGEFDPYKMRIGDVVTYIPPEMIQVATASSVNQFQTLRQKGSAKTKNGSEMKQITMNFYFNGEDQINGYTMNAPEGGVYWMDGLRALLAQFKRVPFLPVENEFLNRTNGIYAMAFSSVSVDTVPGFPGLLNVSCVFYEFDTTAMLGFPSFMFDGMIMYPLFRWYYQQMLVGTQVEDDPKDQGKSATKLKRVQTPLSQEISFAILNEEVLQANRNTIKGWSSDKLDRAFIPFNIDGHFVISNFNATFGNSLTPITLEGVGKPTFQYYGSLDTRIRLSIETHDETVAIQLQSMMETMEHYSRTYRNRFVGGYLKIENDLINMMGVDFCMIEQLTVATVPGFPGTYSIEVSLISFEKTQMDGERLNGWNGFDSKKGIMPTLEDFPGQDPAHFSNFIIQELRAERFLDSLELYPDLELPPYNHLNEQIKLINDYRKKTNWPRLPITSLAKTNPQAVYVDPDFYMIYPDLKDYGEGDSDILGADLDAVLTSKKLSLKRLNKENEAIESKDVGCYQQKWAAPSMTKGKWEALKAKTLSYNYLRDSWKYAKQADGTYDPENYTVNYIRQQPEYEDLKHQMLHDAFKYSKRGSLMRAFPSFVFMIIDEGQWINTRKIWNNYYAYHVVNAISVVRDRKNPADTAYVTLSNIYGSLNYQSKPPYRVSDYLKKFGDGQVGQLLAGLNETYDYIYPSLEQEAHKWASRADLLTAGYLQAGARVHIRMGYSSCASDMPIVFNGVVTETDVGDEMSIICQGDGVELINSQIPADGNELNFRFEEGDTGQSMIQYFLTKPHNDFLFNATDSVAAALGRNSKYGIEHFGYVRQATDTDWKIGNFWNQLGHTLTGWSSAYVDPNEGGWSRGQMDPYDVVKNVYSTNGAAATSGVTDQDNKGEMINTFISGKTPWDIFRLIQKTHTDYIVSPVYHNFHSTLFFGMPHWLCKQGWVLPEGAKGEVINDYKDFTKPFAQIHFLNSVEDIIHNGIKATGHDLITHCYPMFYKGNGEKTGPTVGKDVFADQRIRPELQKSKIVDTTIVQSYVANWIWQAPFQGVAWLEGKFEYVWDQAANMAADILDIAHEQYDKLTTWLTGIEHKTPKLGRENPRWDVLTAGEQQSLVFAISTIAESFKDMYQGSLQIIGDTAIKPHDLVYLNDFYTQMHGLVEVQRVVHNMSFETGFTTELTPDLAVAQVYGESYRSGEFTPSSKVSPIQIGMEIGALVSVRAMRTLLGMATLKSYNNAVRLGNQTLKLANKSEVVADAFKAGRGAFSAASELPTFAKMGQFLKGTRNTLKAAITGFEVATIEGTIVAGPEVWVGVLIEAGIFIIMDMAIDELFDWLNMDHNCIKIFPLYYKGHPYVAGISGHKNLIPGQQDAFTYGDATYTLEGDPVGWQGGN